MVKSGSYTQSLTGIIDTIVFGRENPITPTNHHHHPCWLKVRNFGTPALSTWFEATNKYWMPGIFASNPRLFCLVESMPFVNLSWQSKFPGRWGFFHSLKCAQVWSCQAGWSSKCYFKTIKPSWKGQFVQGKSAVKSFCITKNKYIKYNHQATRSTCSISYPIAHQIAHRPKCPSVNTCKYPFIAGINIYDSQLFGFVHQGMPYVSDPFPHRS